MAGSNVTEIKIVNIRAYGDRSVGCIHNNANIMISYQTVLDGKITDMFLEQKQAERFLDDLNRCLNENTRKSSSDKPTPPPGRIIKESMMTL